VRYVDPDIDGKKKDEDKGFLSKLMFWKGGAADKPTQAQYRIQVKTVGETTTVQVLTREGGIDRSDTSSAFWAAARTVEVSKKHRGDALCFARQRQPRQCLAGGVRPYPLAGRCRIRPARNVAPAGAAWAWLRKMSMRYWLPMSTRITSAAFSPARADSTGLFCLPMAHCPPAGRNGGASVTIIDSQEAFSVGD
jgi:hypothetical protein